MSFSGCVSPVLQQYVAQFRRAADAAEPRHRIRIVVRFVGAEEVGDHAPDRRFIVKIAAAAIRIYEGLGFHRHHLYEEALIELL